MTPAQIEGLQVCLCLASSMVILAPLFCWVLPNRQHAL